ncbi:hypothetical protein CAEBREN_00682 [Caenorhabditis brenneri]|uniref:Uncharacterized protein n=1 Tax=Caenorhabditis brenneri TaxID=135651 RepID=G0MIX1_CAEBE|nr:hypothetical protein CAEBREN_00682 [Caenorhabditis brenneri]
MAFVPLFSDYNCFAHGHPNKFYEPRLLVQMALEDEKLAIEVRELGLGITDLVIKQHDNGNVTLKVLIGVGPGVEPLFHLGTWDKCHLRGIDITIQHYGKEEKRRVPGLFEIGRVGFYG